MFPTRERHTLYNSQSEQRDWRTTYLQTRPEPEMERVSEVEAVYRESESDEHSRESGQGIKTE